MAPKIPDAARAVVEKARAAATRLRPGQLEGQRSLPIRRSGDELRTLWSDGAMRAAVLDGIPVADAALSFGDQDRDWGTVVSARIRLKTAVPGIAAQALAGKALRRLKALAETGEVPTTAHNPSARAGAGEEAS